MKTLRAHGFNQRPRFEQVVGYLERNEPLPQATSTWTILCSPARTPTLGPAAHPAEATDEDVRLARRYQGTAEPALLRTTWRAGRGRPPSRTVCAALQTARRRQRTSWAQGRRGLQPQLSTCA